MAKNWATPIEWQISLLVGWGGWVGWMAVLCQAAAAAPPVKLFNFEMA